MIKIFNNKDIKEWENHTLLEDQITNHQLMYQASETFANWLDKKLLRDDMTVAIICGSGNNGGDGYCLASILLERGVKVTVFSYPFQSYTDSCLFYKNKYNGDIHELSSTYDFESLKDFTFVIDALLGSGINRDVEGELEDIIHQINHWAQCIYSIDIPSGVFPDQITTGTSIQATETLSFQIPKLAFFATENYERIGKWEFRDIKLSTEFLKTKDSNTYLIDKNALKRLVKKRQKFSHKYHYGNHLIIGGNIGMAGAVTLCAKASYRMGTGVVSILSDEGNRVVHQSSIPEAIFYNKKESIVSNKISAITVGPGMGNRIEWLDYSLLNTDDKKIVIDADGLNILSEKEMVNKIPKGAIITPHKGEFNRLFGPCENDFQYWKKQREFSKKLQIYIVFKGAHTSISTPDGKLYFNNNGNPGMATAGSGDVLAGMISGLLAQDYLPLDACLLGVFMHGLCGDLALKSIGMESMVASDLINHIAKSWQIIKS